MTAADEWTPHAGELTFLGHPALDAVLDVCLELAAELWVARQRLAEIEQQLVDSGAVTPPDDVDAARLAESDHRDRDAFVRRVLGPLLLTDLDDAT